MKNCLIAAISALVLVPTSVWAWGSGHQTIARESLKRLPGTWGERLRADKELGKLFVKSALAPDDMKTKLGDRSAYFDGEMIAAFPPKTVMYTFHEAPSRCHLLRQIARAMKRGDGRAVAFALGCYSHGAADIYAPGHAPVAGLASSVWRAYGAKGFGMECCDLERSADGRAILTRVIDADAGCLPYFANASADEVFDELVFEPTLALSVSAYEEEHTAGGERCQTALAHEAARGVWGTVRACATAERWAELDAAPAFDHAGSSKRAAKRTHEYLANRPLEADTYVRGVMPKSGRVFETGVVYDPLGRWTRGMTYITCRPLAVQVATSLAKTRDAGIVDIREILKDGVPAGMKTLVVPGSGIMSYEGFSKERFLAEVGKFRARGGRLLWIAGAGGQKPPREIFPDTEKLFLANPVRPEYCKSNGPVPAEKLPGCKLVLPDGRSFTAVRKPTGIASWHWDQLSLRYVLGYLPKGAVSTVEFEATDGTRATLGYAAPGICYLPAWAIMPYVFTKTVPQVDPLVLSLDEAGEAIVNATLDACAGR